MKLRAAIMDDLPALQDLIRRSAVKLSTEHYSAAQIDAALQGAFGVDTQLIHDGSYFVVVEDESLVACGGWSFRKTLFGGDTHTERHPESLNPDTDAAKIRAFFIAPEYARRGLGTMILNACESAAKEAGFQRLELMSTLPGVKFYASRGFVAGEPKDFVLPGEVSITFLPMQKTLAQNGVNNA